ncbi:ATP-dependent DNA helicase [Methanofollis ethanolicus]|jgi:DNA helicase-2/ATP-dependent DNA helicase PcrA|uniref:ATP-dependent DNA helicase n=1 Tax=Methanofollis ethanolicus TaxID=488124 RepID=UPI00082BA11C|nr:ATP-dependent DNA helicase [Methanofollis ethanolicus]
MPQDKLQYRILNEPFKLSSPQIEAVLSKKNRVRVVAGAGAGKTETLTRKIVHLLMEKKASPSSIVAFTFTEKAAQSMKSRVYDRIRYFGGDAVCAQLGDMYVGTIHAYCARLLEDFFGYGGYSILDENQEMAYLHRFGWDLNILSDKSHSQKCQIFRRNLNVVYADMLPRHILKERAEDFAVAIQTYEQSLDDHRKLTFDRIIDITVKELEKHPEKTQHIRYLIVDEYQDINRAQERLIQLLSRNAQLFVVGDPRQTIYQWRGSDDRCFENFVNEKNASVTAGFTIAENRRSARAIVDTANAFAHTFDGVQYDPMVSVRRDDGGAYLVEMRSNLDEARWIAEQVQRYVDEGTCNYKDIGILLRSVNTSGPVFIDEFRRLNIPYIVGGKVGLFRRPEAQAVGKLIAWINGDKGFFQKSRWDFHNQIRGNELLVSGITDWCEIIDDETLLKSLPGKLENWRGNVLDGVFTNFTEMYYDLLSVLGYERLDPDNVNDAVVMANLGRFSTLLTDYETAIMLDGKKRNWEKDLKGFCWFLNSFANSAYEEQPGDDIRNVNAVQLMTIHQSKGLEWSVVFVPAVVESRFPSNLMGRHGTWLMPGDLFGQARYEGDLNSERKLMYVACTRAKDVLVVSYFTTMNGNARSPGVFVIAGPLRDKLQHLSQADLLPLHSLTPSHDSEEVVTYATGELIIYGRCPYMYRMNRMWGYEPGLKPRIGYGRTLHHCLREAADLIREEKLDPITGVAEAVKTHFYLPFAGRGQRAGMKDAAREKLINFAVTHEADMYHIREVESRIEFPLQNATVVGKVDVILHDREGIEVRDYKTSDRVVSRDEAAFQVRLYAQGLSMLGEEVKRGSIAYLDDASVADVSVCPEDLASVVAMAEQRVTGIQNHEFPAQPGENCKNCDYHTICKFSNMT